MNCNSLRQLLDRVSPNTKLWSVPGSVERMACDLIGLLDAGCSAVDPLRGKRVAIFSECEIDLASLMVLFDGICEQITILPNVDDPAVLRAVVDDSGCELVVTGSSSSAVLDLDPLIIDLKLLWQPPSSIESPPRPLHLTRWVIPTSGTSGRPKLVSHSLASLTRALKNDVRRGSEFRWGLLYRLSSFAGLQVFLQSWYGGSTLTFGRPDASLADRIEGFLKNQCTALSATPTMWRKLLMGTRITELPLRQITLGGEIVDQKVLDVLAEAFPQARILHVYASTEAGVGFSIRDGRAGFPADYLHSPPAGVAIRVDGAGRLSLRHANRADQFYLDGRLRLKDDDGYVDTGDVVHRHGDRYVFQGRANGTINVGGNKVHPEEVEEALLQCTDVQMARVIARKSPITGALVQAEVVVSADCQLPHERLKSALIEHCRKSMEPYKVPAFIRFVTSIETTSSGKVKRGS